ncbi:type VI secretion system baseplate subunit TssE [Grimontia sp. NTOU-MAR1]|uniref:type VI secretion system baseplate subunit TssE n=1 Tax=Grimontia sp. NTOU-MAR1 TaxID=3111011 RepID=UPI002DBB46B8|nr:type VI secretion system baseplate subunit TssE [Grimontia sp. NTOU-MAR1]WRV97765.1 type VI secretion system baseplate subunit TssE [Grimontia sp. NTOU-MAR1]
MKQQRLLERIRSGGENSSDKELLLDSITNHIHRILNTQQGSVPIDKDFGMPDFSDLRWGEGSDIRHDLEKFLSELILKYERRVKSVNVYTQKDNKSPLVLCFVLEAKIELKNKIIPLVFETVLKSDGYIALQRK